MERSEVYFSDLRCTFGQSQLDKLKRLIKRAGMGEIDFEDKLVAVKIHFGEWGNLAHLRPQYARVMCEYIKEQGGKPFLTDANTLYAGYRNNAVAHLGCAAMNGYNELVTGVPIIIADGLRGTDERLIPVPAGKHVKEAKVASAVAEADVVISLSHFKGHMVAGFGGALKNIGMGCGSKMGKMEMHSAGTPAIDEDLCCGCGACARNCANAGVEVQNGKARITDTCVGCGHCFSFCPKGAIECKWDEAKAVMSEKVAEYTWATLAGKPHFHVSFVMDVSPDCDCDPGNDVPMVPDVGMFASFDPVALDQACVDAVNAQPVFMNSAIAQAAREHECCHAENAKDIFKLAHPDVCWEAGLTRGEELGLGTRNYQLIDVS